MGPVETARGAGRRIRDLPALNSVEDLTGAAAAYVVVGADDSVGADFRISSRIFD